MSSLCSSPLGRKFSLFSRYPGPTKFFPLGTSFSPKKTLRVFSLDIFLSSTLVCPDMELKAGQELRMLSRGTRAAQDITKAAGTAGVQGPRGNRIGIPISDSTDKKGMVHIPGHHRDNQGKQINHGDSSGKKHPQDFSAECSKPSCKNLICNFKDACAWMALKSTFWDYRGNRTHSPKVLGKEVVPLNPTGTFRVNDKQGIKVPSQEVDVREDILRQDEVNGNQEKLQIEAQKMDTI